MGDVINFPARATQDPDYLCKRLNENFRREPVTLGPDAYSYDDARLASKHDFAEQLDWLISELHYKVLYRGFTSAEILTDLRLFLNEVRG